MKVNMFGRYVFIIYTLLRVSLSYGQTDKADIDSLISRESFSGSNSSSVLFVHFDKNIYINNENVWFTAYLLNSAKENNPTILSLLMVNEHDKQIVYNQKFVM